MQKKIYIVFSLFSAMFFQRAIFILYLLDRNISHANIGLLQTILLVTIILSDFPIGILSDKFGKKFTLAMGCFLMVINAFSMTLVDSFLGFIVLFIVEGVGFAALSNSIESLIYEDSERKKYDFSKFMTVISLVGSIGLGVSIYIGGIAYSYNANYAYYATCVTSIFALISVIFIKEVHAEVIEHQSIRILLRNSIGFISNNIPFQIWKMVGVYSAIFSVTAPFIIFFQELLFNKGYSTSNIGLVIGGAEICGAVIVLGLSGMLLNNKTDLRILSVLVLLCTSLLVFDSFVAILVSILVMSVFSVFLWITLNKDVHDLLNDEIRTSAMSIITSIIALFMAISYWVQGIVIDLIGVVDTLILSGFLPLVTLLLYSTYGFFQHREKYA